MRCIYALKDGWFGQQMNSESIHQLPETRWPLTAEQCPAGRALVGMKGGNCRLIETFNCSVQCAFIAF